MTFAAVALLAFVGVLVGSPVVIAWLRERGVIDMPNARSSHDIPTPRGVGIAVVLGVGGAGALAAVVLSETLEIAVVTLVATMCAVIGFIEDIRGVSQKWRLAFQLLLALAAVGAIVGLPQTIGGWCFSVLAVVGLIAYVNAVNFMDGINGISAMHGIAVGSVWACAGFLSDARGFAAVGVLIASGCAGFLPWNFPSAKGFLGDVGSYFLGGWLGAGAIVGFVSGVNPRVVAAPLAVYVIDTGLTIVQRFLRHEPLLAAHRAHVYQRLVRLGWSHARSTLFVTSIAVVLSVAALYGTSVLVVTTLALATTYGFAPVLVRVHLDRTTGSRVISLRPDTSLMPSVIPVASGAAPDSVPEVAATEVA